MSTQPQQRSPGAPFDDLDEGIIDLHDVARQRRLTRRQMARWAGREHAGAVLDTIIAFAERRAAVLLATARAEAIRSLLTLARTRDTEKFEVARKACNDLIRMGIAPPAREPAAGTLADDAPPTPAEIARAFDSLRRMDEELGEDEAFDDEEPGAAGAD